MTVQVRFLAVGDIRVCADGGPEPGRGERLRWWQVLQLFDASGGLIGEITLHLTGPEVALPVGEQPPYWGVDPRRVGALALRDGESPF